MMLLGVVVAVGATEDVFLSDVAVILVDMTGARRFMSMMRIHSYLLQVSHSYKYLVGSVFLCCFQATKKQKGKKVILCMVGVKHITEVFEREDIDWMDAVEIKPGARLEPCPLRRNPQQSISNIVYKAPRGRISTTTLQNHR